MRAHLERAPPPLRTPKPSKAPLKAQLTAGDNPIPKGGEAALKNLKNTKPLKRKRGGKTPKGFKGGIMKGRESP